MKLDLLSFWKCYILPGIFEKGTCSNYYLSYLCDTYQDCAGFQKLLPNLLLVLNVSWGKRNMYGMHQTGLAPKRHNVFLELYAPACSLYSPSGHCEQTQACLKDVVFFSGVKPLSSALQNETRTLRKW